MLSERELFYRRKVDRFSMAMMGKLLKHQNKGGWENCTPEWLIGRVENETSELVEAIIKKEGILSEAADVANFALMVADVCGTL